MSVFWYEYLVHTNGRSVLHWIYTVVVRKYEKNCWYQIIKSISIYYTLSYRPLQMNAIMLMVDRPAVTVDAVVAIMVNEMLTIGTRVQRNRLPVQQTTMLHRYPSLQNAVLRTEEVLAVAPTVTTTMPDTRNRLIDT